MSIQEILESAGLPAQRGVYTGRDKPDAYYTFLRLLGTPAVNADDEEKERREMYRVTLFHTTGSCPPQRGPPRRSCRAHQPRFPPSGC